MRELTSSDALDAVWGGSVLACGGGGWVDHGLMMGEIATRLGRPVLCSVDDLATDDVVVTVTAIGAPASPNWEIRPLDYVRAFELVAERVGRPVKAVMTAQNGSSTTLNGWIQSAIHGIKVLDAAGDVRAHPTGKLGAMGLTERLGYKTVQAVAGGNRELCGGIELVVEGDVTPTSDILREVCVRVGGFIAAARPPVPAQWVRDHAALGAIGYALALGAAMRSAEGDAAAVIDAAVESTGGAVLVRGKVRFVDPLRTTGGFDRGSFSIDGYLVHFLNEHMTVDRGAERVATYPDVITVLSAQTGRPLAIAEMKEGEEVALLTIDRAHLPLSSGTKDRTALADVEQIMGVALVDSAAT